MDIDPRIKRDLYPSIQGQSVQEDEPDREQNVSQATPTELDIRGDQVVGSRKVHLGPACTFPVPVVPEDVIDFTGHDAERIAATVSPCVSVDGAARVGRRHQFLSRMMEGKMDV